MLSYIPVGKDTNVEIMHECVVRVRTATYTCINDGIHNIAKRQCVHVHCGRGHLRGGGGGQLPPPPI